MSHPLKTPLRASQAEFRPQVEALRTELAAAAGIHINWYNTFQFAHAYARGEGMKHYTQMVQEPEFAAREKGYTSRKSAPATSTT